MSSSWRFLQSTSNTLNSLSLRRFEGTSKSRTFQGTSKNSAIGISICLRRTGGTSSSRTFRGTSKNATLRSFFTAIKVLIGLLFYGTKDVRSEDLLADGTGILPLSRRAVTDFWSMASITAAASSLPGISGSMSSATEIANALYNNPDLAPLFKEMPNLISELRQLDKEQINNILFLFRLYHSLPPGLIKFFHSAISKTKSIAPAVQDMAKLNIAGELTTYVQSVTHPVNNMFSTIATYLPKIHRRALGRGPPWGKVAATVGGIVAKNIATPQLIPVSLLATGLTQLSKAYINGNLKMPKLPGKVVWKPINQVFRPKRPRRPAPKPRPPTPAATPPPTPPASPPAEK